MTPPVAAYRCGLPVAMGFLGIGSLAVVAGAGTAVIVAAQVLLGVGRYGRIAKTHGLAGLRIR
ncbi:hypothetical protein L332_03530 [Agrococcus pavilionensis RW1]|uniref:Uncharacterized protein n=1 Tax=Agrococcus pavilionensis RW1 TaxID=1330458 RepID=U1MS83_9MICO|nr:hypothetical protein [Agrococcus pavilionensis]ERG63525.1 hypothetical protein L332_03530 [Agrococcus pavilionensis RW1]